MHLAEGSKKQVLQAELLGLAGILGLLQNDPEEWFTLARKKDDLPAEEVEALIAERKSAKDSKDYAGADGIRQQLLDAGIILEDSREGTTWRRA